MILMLLFEKDINIFQLIQEFESLDKSHSLKMQTQNYHSFANWPGNWFILFGFLGYC